MKKQWLMLTVMVGVIQAAGSTWGESWDLAGQWSEEHNPNGAWSYEQPKAETAGSYSSVMTQSGEMRVYRMDPKALADKLVLSRHVEGWSGEPNVFSGAQSAWLRGEASATLPGVFRSTGKTTLDLPAGRVAGYTPFLIRWTAPRKMVVTMRGGVWMPRDINRIAGVSCGKTSVKSQEAMLLFDEFPVPGSAGGFGSAQAMPLRHIAQIMNGTDEALRRIPVEKDDSLWLLFKMRNEKDEFIGVDWTISEAGEEAKPADAKKASNAGESRLFTTDTPASQWVTMKADGFSAPVTGVVYRRETPATNGVALGGVDTGCLDLETSGLWGFCTIFNTHVPRRGPINLPFLGVSVGGETWVLCDPEQAKPAVGNFQPPFSYHFPHHMAYLKKQGDPIAEHYVQELHLEGVKTPREIHYWGHYPAADMEFDTDGPVSVGLRAWTLFLPGDIKNSMIPGIVFEVHLRNGSGAKQKGTVALSFPGPTAREAGTETFDKNTLQGGDLTGLLVHAPQADYVLAALEEKKVRTGGELGGDGGAWAKIAKQLPANDRQKGGACVAVDFGLGAGKTKVVRYLLTWYAPQWKGGGKNWSTSGNTFTHMYAKYYTGAEQTAKLLAKKHQNLLKRTLAWQEAVYADKNTPGWLADALINSLYMITETGLWAQAGGALPTWVREEDGLFGMNECPRTCPQLECIPCGFYGNQPLIYFYPELALSTYRGYKGYMFPDGAAPWVWGGWTASNPPIDMAMPGKGYQWTTNGISLAAMIDRYLVCRGKENPDFVQEFHPAVKKNMIYTVNLRTSPEYTIGQRVLMMPNGDEGGEWFEAGNPAWFGMTTHAGGLHLVQLRIAKRLADLAGDAEFSKQCQEWLDVGMAALEEHLWNGSYYLNCFDPRDGRKDDLVFAFQLDGQWIAEAHGLEGVFRKDRVKTTLATIKRCNAAISKMGVVNYAKADGSAAPVGGYGPYSWFPPEVLMLAMQYMYEGDKDYGMMLARRCWENIFCKHRYTWDMPNIIRGDKDTGERGFMNGGHDYYQDLMLWSLPAALAGEDLSGPCQKGGLVERILQAAK